MNITKEAMQAETKLRNLRKRGETAADNVRLKWADKEDQFVGSLSPQVKSVLRYAGVLEREDLSVAQKWDSAVETVDEVETIEITADIEEELALADKD